MSDQEQHQQQQQRQQQAPQFQLQQAGPRNNDQEQFLQQQAPGDDFQKVPFPGEEVMNQKEKGPSYQIASASAGKFISTSVSSSDFDAKTGGLTNEAEQRIEKEVHQRCKDRNIAHDIMRGYRSAAKELRKSRQDNSRFEVFSYSCMLHFRGERSGNDDEDDSLSLKKIELTLPSKVAKKE